MSMFSTMVLAIGASQTNLPLVAISTEDATTPSASPSPPSPFREPPSSSTRPPTFGTTRIKYEHPSPGPP
ncbi:hypothetical protein PG989_011904 [Apiospora arundinis]